MHVHFVYISILIFFIITHHLLHKAIIYDITVIPSKGKYHYLSIVEKRQQ